MTSALPRVEWLRGEVAAHKAAIRRHRSALSRAKAALVAAEETELAARGIKLIVQGEGGIHGPIRKAEHQVQEAQAAS